MAKWEICSTQKVLDSTKQVATGATKAAVANEGMTLGVTDLVCLSSYKN